MPSDTEMEERRRSMLMRRGSTGSESDAMRRAIFESRSLSVQNEIPQNPSLVVEESTDPQRLFQLLRRRKKVPHVLAAPAPHAISPPVAVPEPSPPTCNSARGPSRDMSPAHLAVTRPAFSARPFTPVDRPPTVASRDIQSASVGDINGRPCTRQKHPRRSLDLFPSALGELRDVDPFPKPATLPRRTSGNKQPLATSGPTLQPGQREVNFNCLFFKSEDELDSRKEVFPGNKAPANIPLIETDWFSSESWEQLPTTDGAPTVHDEELGPEGDEHMGSVYAESLYELLVASKRRPCAR